MCTTEFPRETVEFYLLREPVCGLDRLRRQWKTGTLNRLVCNLEQLFKAIQEALNLLAGLLAGNRTTTSGELLAHLLPGGLEVRHCPQPDSDTRRDLRYAVPRTPEYRIAVTFPQPRARDQAGFAPVLLNRESRLFTHHTNRKSMLAKN